MNQSQAIQIYNTLFATSDARVFARYEGVPDNLEEGPSVIISPGKQRAAQLLRAMADALAPAFSVRTDHERPPAKIELNENVQVLADWNRAAEYAMRLHPVADMRCEQVLGPPLAAFAYKDKDGNVMNQSYELFQISLEVPERPVGADERAALLAKLMQDLAQDVHTRAAHRRAATWVWRRKPRIELVTPDSMAGSALKLYLRASCRVGFLTADEEYVEEKP